MDVPRTCGLLSDDEIHITDLDTVALSGGMCSYLASTLVDLTHGNRNRCWQID